MNLLIKTFHGLEQVLADELKALNAKEIKVLKRAVSCEADKELLYKANLHLRTALRVLVPIETFTATNEDELYKGIYNIDWSKYMKVDNTFAIDAVTFSDLFKHSKFLALKTKDAIADQFREKYDRRPDVNVENPDLSINVHVARDKFTISLDSSGESLHRRGYRSPGHKAPLNEVLAAGLLKLAEWNKDIPLVDPMCGTGTILMEAAMMACSIPPGRNRKSFGFMNWADFDATLWKQIKDDAEKQISHPKTNIVGADINPKAVDLAKTASLNARLNRQIRIMRADVKDHEPTAKKGMIITNPPYGERLQKSDIVKFYKTLGDTFKNNFPGYDVWVITSNESALKHIGLKPSKKLTLFNGPLECKFAKYELFDGFYIDYKTLKNKERRKNYE